MGPITCREELIANGGPWEFLFFWGHRPRADGRVGPECLSQWWPARFQVDEVSYPTAEHFMMAEKARLFGDQKTRQAILAAPDPARAKKLGRTVAGFVPETWETERFAIVVRANLAKFSAHPPLARFMLDTGQRVLVEASPYDRIWGIGMAASDPRAGDPEQWEGENLLGFALMQVRHQLSWQV